MKSIALCPVYDMLSFYFIGLLHKIENDCKHSILTVCTLEYLIAEQAILRDQACFFSKNVKGAGCIKRAGWNYFIKN